MPVAYWPVESSYVAIIMVSAMGETGILLVFVPSLFLIMLLVLETGRRIGKRYYSMEESDHHRGNRILVESAIYGLLGLLIVGRRQQVRCTAYFDGAGSERDWHRLPPP